MSSAGQIIGGIVGFAVGGPVGAQIGAGLGGIIDPPKGPKIEGPRLDDLSVQTSSYGAKLPRVYGKQAVRGNVFWVENNSLREVARKESQGGKGGGGGSSVTTYEYYATFAVSLCDSEIEAVDRVWMGDKLISAPSADDYETAVESSAVRYLMLYRATGSPVWLGQLAALNQGQAGGQPYFVVYPGRDDQEPDPRMEADLGVGNCPAYRGRAYIVFYDWPLRDFGNSLLGAQVKAEVITKATGGDYQLLHSRVQRFPHASIPGSNTSYLCVSNYLDPERCVAWVHEGVDDFWVTGTPPDEVHHRVYHRMEFNGRASQVGPGFETAGDPGARVNNWLQADTPLFFDVVEVPEGDGIRPDKATVKDGWAYGIVRSGIGALSRGVYRWKQTPGVAGYFFSSLAAAQAPVAIAVDDDENCYVLCEDKTIRKYDSGLVHQTTHAPDWDGGSMDTVSLSGLGTQSFYALHMNYDSGFIWVIRWDSGGDDVYALPITLDVDVTYFGKSPNIVQSSSSFYSELKVVKGNILCRFLSGGGGVYGFATLDEEAYFDTVRLPYPAGDVVNLADIVREELERTELIEPADIDVSLLTDTVRGYAPAGINSARSVIAPLQQAYSFDIIPDGYQIKCVPRGQASVVTIPEEDLIEIAEDQLIEYNREEDSQLTKKVIYRYFDEGREYDINEQRSQERVATVAINQLEVEGAIVFSADEAASIAETIQNRRWQERHRYKCAVPPIYPYNRIQPADVVTIELSYVTLELFVEQITVAQDGVMTLEGFAHDASVYSPNVTGSSGLQPVGTIPYGGAAEAVLLDIPVILDDQDSFNFVAAMAGYSASWIGGTLFRSRDSEQTWSAAAGFADGVVMGQVVNSLSAHDGLTIDYQSTLTLDLLSPGMSLDSVTLEQMLTGKHWFAYGVDGRWEICRFANATLNGDGTYTIYTITRGEKGTERYTGTHQAFDWFVLLDDIDIATIGIDSQDLNVTRHYRAVSINRDISDSESQAYAYQGVNLKPISPVLAKGVQNGNDWDLTWVRRSRLNTSYWTSGVERPSGEDSIAFEIDIMDGSTVVRTLNSTTEAVTYTSADQVTDFGSNQSSITVKIYQMSAQVGRGYELEATF